MQSPELPDNEPDRLRALQALDILDSPPEERFDRLTRLAKQMFGVEIALVSLVDEQRQWFKSVQGLEVCETHRDISFCGHAILNAELFMVSDASQDPRFSDNPLVLNAPYIRFYAGVPLVSVAGFRLGTFCIIDSQPRELDEAQQAALVDLARCAEDELNFQREQSARQQAQDAGKRAQEMLEAIPDLVFVMDREGRFLNCQNRDDLVISKHQLLNRTIAEMVPAELARKTLEAIAEALDRDQLVKFETPFELPAGSAWFEARVRRLDHNQVLVLIRNVTRERATQRRLAGVLEGTRIGTWEWNVQTGETVFNQRWADICGYTLEELAPISIQTWMNLAHPDDLAESDRLLQEHFAGKRDFYDHECRMRHKDGHWVWVHDRGRVISRTDAGAPRMMYGTHADITERKHIERMKNEFVSTVSHELRTPLTSIAASLRLITGGAVGELPAQMNEMMGIAYKNSQRLTSLINDLLDMEKLISGKMHFALERQALLPLVAQSVANNELYAAQFQVSVVLASTAANPEVLVDAQRLEQVMANLLSNAAKFSPPNEQVSVMIDVINDFARVSVIDRGPGVPPEFRDQIFQKFAQADGSDSRQKGGTGLGLAICKEFIERMAGRIDYVSEPDRETCFYFELPLITEGSDPKANRDPVDFNRPTTGPTSGPTTG